MDSFTFGNDIMKYGIDLLYIFFDTNQLFNKMFSSFLKLMNTDEKNSI